MDDSLEKQSLAEEAWDYAVFLYKLFQKHKKNDTIKADKTINDSANNRDIVGDIENP